MTETTRAASAKKPSDHKPKASAMLSATYDGQKFEIDPEVFDDYEFLELSGQTTTDPTRLPLLLILVFGKDGHLRLKDLARGESGRVSTEKMMEIYQAIMEEAGAKNS